MRLKLDENIDARLSVLVHEAGHDATTVREQGLHGSEDPVLFSHCVSEDRILAQLPQLVANKKNFLRVSAPSSR